MTRSLEVQVSAFQINDRAILTVKDGDELLTSGSFPVREAGPGLKEIDFGEGELLTVTVDRTNDDPGKLGVVEGQVRIYWAGRASLDEDVQ